MKLIFCPLCYDLFNLTKRKRCCSCKNVWGKYLEDGWLARISSTAIPFGIDNHSFRRSIEHRPIEGQGERIEAFIIPEVCPTIDVVQTEPKSKQLELIGE